MPGKGARPWNPLSPLPPLLPRAIILCSHNRNRNHEHNFIREFSPRLLCQQRERRRRRRLSAFNEANKVDAATPPCSWHLPSMFLIILPAFLMSLLHNNWFLLGIVFSRFDGDSEGCDWPQVNPMRHVTSCCLSWPTFAVFCFALFGLCSSFPPGCLSPLQHFHFHRISQNFHEFTFCPVLNLLLWPANALAIFLMPTQTHK